MKFSVEKVLIKMFGYIKNIFYICEIMMQVGKNRNRLGYYFKFVKNT